MNKFKLPATNNGHDELQAALQRRLRLTSVKGHDGGEMKTGETYEIHAGELKEKNTGNHGNIHKPKPKPKERSIAKNQHEAPSPASSISDDNSKKQCLLSAEPTKPKPKISAKPAINLTDIKAAKGKGKKPSIKPRPSLRKLKRQSSSSGRKNGSSSSRSSSSPVSPSRGDKKLTIAGDGNINYVGQNSVNGTGGCPTKENKQPVSNCNNLATKTAENAEDQRCSESRVMEQYEDVELLNGFVCVNVDFETTGKQNGMIACICLL